MLDSIAYLWERYQSCGYHDVISHGPCYVKTGAMLRDRLHCLVVKQLCFSLGHYYRAVLYCSSYPAPRRRPYVTITVITQTNQVPYLVSQSKWKEVQSLPPAGHWNNTCECIPLFLHRQTGPQGHSTGLHRWHLWLMVLYKDYIIKTTPACRPRGHIHEYDDLCQQPQALGSVISSILNEYSIYSSGNAQYTIL